MNPRKHFYQNISFWLIAIPTIVFLMMAYPWISFLFKRYIYLPPVNPDPGEFVVSTAFQEPEKQQPEFEGFNSLPEEEYEITAGFDEEELTIVQAHQDGYRLTLPSHMYVSTWDFSSGQVMVTEPPSNCSASVYKFEENTIQEAFESSVTYHQEMEDMKAYKIMRDELEVIENPNLDLEAYLHHYEDDMFGYQPSIKIQGDSAAYGISQRGMRYPECDLMMRVLKGFEFINQN